jgi:predicted nucleic acid-binding protein
MRACGRWAASTTSTRARDEGGLRHRRLRGLAAARRALDRLGHTYSAARRQLAPTTETFRRAGDVLRALRAGGRDVRRAALVHDVLIALSAREIGAIVYTADEADFAAIREIAPFRLSVLAAIP